MNKSLLTIGIIVSLGSVGCMGLGVQHSSNLTARIHAERGVDDLWAEADAPPTGAETPLYSEQTLGDLWDSSEDRPLGVADPGYDPERGADLWNPASVTRSWEPTSAPSSQGYRFSRTLGSSLQF